jgi:hypothetical protein
VHEVLHDGNEGFELLAHSLAEDVLLLLDLQALHAHLGLVSHAADHLKGTNSALPLSGLLAQVLLDRWEKTENLGLGGEVVEKLVKRILG